MPSGSDMIKTARKFTVGEKLLWVRRFFLHALATHKIDLRLES